MSDICEWMIKHHYAKNVFNAQAIFIGLRLDLVPRFWERVQRIVVYRQWRDAGERSKIAFQNVLDGKQAPKTLFEKAEHK